MPPWGMKSVAHLHPQFAMPKQNYPGGKGAPRAHFLPEIAGDVFGFRIAKQCRGF